MQCLCTVCAWLCTMRADVGRAVPEEAGEEERKEEEEEGRALCARTGRDEEDA